MSASVRDALHSFAFPPTDILAGKVPNHNGQDVIAALLMPGQSKKGIPDVEKMDHLC